MPNEEINGEVLEENVGDPDLVDLIQNIEGIEGIDLIRYEIMPVTAFDVGSFFNACLQAFKEPLFLIFTFMIAASIGFYVRQLILGRSSL